MSGPRNCGACKAPVIQAFTARGTALLLDYPPTPAGAIAAHVDGETGIWRARYLDHGETVPDTEVRFRQHTVTCRGRGTDSQPIYLAPDMEEPAVARDPP